MNRVFAWLVPLLTISGLGFPVPSRGREGPPPAQSPAGSIAASAQLIVVETADWGAIDGRLQRFDRSPRGWRAAGSSWPVLIGRTGLAWDDSISAAPPTKREGDGKSPAGVFGLAAVFGKPKFATAVYPFLTLRPGMVGVDDPKSRYYNRIIDPLRLQGKPDWGSAENMWISSYELGIVVDYNLHPATPGRGSCIFLHIWDEGEPTSGCTAMARPELEILCHWLRSTEHPMLVQLPRAQYEKLQSSWGLPAGGAPSDS